MTEPKTVALVLGSGGARGLAHIGVIRELEDRGHRIASIVGCSMGALIGGFHAAGKLDDYASWVEDLSEWDVLRYLDISLTSRSGMMKGDLIMSELETLVGEQRIEDLPIPFTAVATDVVNKREVWIDRGDLFDAIRASIAIPGIFTPKELNGRTLLDGGLLNPLPVAPATKDVTDVTIAVSLAGRHVAEPMGPRPPEPTKAPVSPHREKIEGFITAVQQKLGMDTLTGQSEQKAERKALAITDIMMNGFDTMQAAISRFRLAAYPPDVLIEIPDNICKTHEFFRAAQLIEAGRYWARQRLCDESL